MFSWLNKIKRTLKLEFTLLTSLLVMLIVLSISFYVMTFVRNLSQNASNQSLMLNETIARMVTEMAANGINTNSLPKIQTDIENMMKVNLLSYVVVRNVKTKEIEFSTLPDLKNKKLFPSNNLITEIRKKNKMPNCERETYSLVNSFPQYTVHIGFYQAPVLVSSLDSFRKNLAGLVAIFICLGFLLSRSMVNMVIRPINQLVDSSTKMAQGDLSNRIEECVYIEINRLIFAYNIMAENLQQLYNSLENKVKERTKELNNALNELKQTQAMMVHSEKMKSLGELVAGVTHEINNPINFIYGNLIYLKDYTRQLFELIDKYNSYENEISDAHKNEIEEKKKEIDIDFIRSDLPSLLHSCEEGTNRTKNIVADLKNFSRMEEAVFSDVNLPPEIDTILNILHSKYKERIKIHKEYEENLPMIEAYGGQLNQVLMNILDNSIGAIKNEGNIWINIHTEKDKNKCIIQIKDDGCGMDEQTKEKIFNPFFTTKPVGQGTGLGLSISYKIIQSHNGQITVNSKLNEGTTFNIELPINQLQQKVNI